jgi:hypothetical protein
MRRSSRWLPSQPTGDPVFGDDAERRRRHSHADRGNESDGRIAAERIYWDQAGVLVQLGLIDPAGLPVAGAEAAANVLDPSLQWNALIKKCVNDNLL